MATICLWLGCFWVGPLTAQSTNPYFLNGSATQDNCNCYTLTTDREFESGSVWNINKINLTQSFAFTFNVFLGCKDASGADGMVFMLQPISTSVGSAGGGIGFSGIRPSVGITLDTWQNIAQNENNNDPVFDHIAIQVNGDLDHSSSNNRAGPVRIIENSDNAEDCQWHTLRVEWNAATKELKASVDGTERVKATIDLVATLFNGDPMVFWGFSASTGGSSNLQRFCTSLNPQFALPVNSVTCYPQPITFSDASVSFGSIVDWFWEFGDGTSFRGQNPPPHVYPAPGNFTASLRILGNNGCLSDPYLLPVVAGSKPIAAFTRTDNLNCEGVPLFFSDASSVQYGTIDQYRWRVDGQPAASLPNSGWQQAFGQGQHVVELVVTTQEGCVSDPVRQTIPVAPRPAMQWLLDEGCVGEPLQLQASPALPQPAIRQYYWALPNRSDSGALVQWQGTAPGSFPISAFAVGANGCISDTLTGLVNLYQTRAFAGNDTTIIQGLPVQLQGSGGITYSWAPSTGLSNPNIANPVATLQADQTYVLTVATPAGCATSDTLIIKVVKGPAVYVPSAFTPNGDGLNDRLRFVAVGIREVKGFRIYNRYGQAVYSNPDRLGSGWDGRVGGQPAPSGTYVWYIDAITSEGVVIRQQGTIVLIR